MKAKGVLLLGAAIGALGAPILATGAPHPAPTHSATTHSGGAQSSTAKPHRDRTAGAPTPLLSPEEKARIDEKGDGKESDPAEETEHVVKPGETLGGVANRARVPRILIIEANGLKAPYRLHTGQRLQLPRTRHHTVAKGETGFEIAYRYGVPYSSIAVANGLDPESPLKVGQKLLIPSILETASKKPGPKDKADDSADSKALQTDKPGTRPETTAEANDEPETAPRFIWPLEGKLARGFVPRSKSNYHDGLDITAPLNTAVRATAPGVVRFAGIEPESFGRLVVIDHENGWQSAYGFLGKVTVKAGDKVRAQERVGLVGHSGEASRDELHFELRKANHQVDPRDYLPAVAWVRAEGKALKTDKPEGKPKTKTQPGVKTKAGVQTKEKARGKTSVDASPAKKHRSAVDPDALTNIAGDAPAPRHGKPHTSRKAAE